MYLAVKADHVWEAQKEALNKKIENQINIILFFNTITYNTCLIDTYKQLQDMGPLRLAPKINITNSVFNQM